MKRIKGLEEKIDESVRSVPDGGCIWIDIGHSPAWSPEIIYFKDENSWAGYWYIDMMDELWKRDLMPAERVEYEIHRDLYDMLSGNDIESSTRRTVTWEKIKVLNEDQWEKKLKEIHKLNKLQSLV